MHQGSILTLGHPATTTLEQLTSDIAVFMAQPQYQWSNILRLHWLQHTSQTHTSTYQLNSCFLCQPLERLDQQLVSNFCTAGLSHSIKLTFLRQQNSAYIFSIDTGSNAAMHTCQPAVFISNAHAD